MRVLRRVRKTLRAGLGDMAMRDSNVKVETPAVVN